MKNIKVLLSAVILLGTLGATSAARADDPAISKDQFAPGSYCHEKFPAVTGRSLASDDPVLKSSASGDVIDYYGSCSENPVGSDQVQAQKLEREHRWDSNYAS